MHLSGWQEGVEIEDKAGAGNRKKVKCVYCGRYVNVFRSKDAACRGIYLKCKNRECRKVFELRI